MKKDGFSTASGSPSNCKLVTRLPGATMSGFASLLADVLGQPVLDKTNLEGVYDFDLEWTPDDNPSKGGQPQPKPDTMGPSLVTALQETLGLALKPHKVTVEAITITQAEHPSAN